MSIPARTLFDRRVPMRDGVDLSADVYMPIAGPEDGPYPAILIRTPYDNANPLALATYLYFATQGYALVAQDVRGRHDSDGDFYPFFNEYEDGYDSVEWVAAQPWCNGKVGMMGGSYSGWVQWAAARERPPHLAALVSTCAAGRYMEEVPFRNGMMYLEMFTWLNLVGGRVQQNSSIVNWERVLQHRPMRTLDESLGRTNTAWRDWIEHTTLDDYWKPHVFGKEDFERIDVPVLHITGWYDDDQPGAMFFYNGMKAHSPASERQRLLVGPWDHRGTRMPKQKLGGVDFGPGAVEDVNAAHKAWFDHWLKDEDTDVMGGPACRYFVMGTNGWSDGPSWPPAEAEDRSYFLSSAGNANTLDGDGRLITEQPSQESPDMYLYDPDDPAGSMPDRNFFPPVGVEPTDMAMDRRFFDRRPDVVVYTSDPLEEAVGVAGQPWFELFASSDRPDTDWVVTLSDVDATGRSVHIARGELRARFREGVDQEVFMEPGEVYRFLIELHHTCHVFQEGHRIRVSVTSSDFPLYDTNPNTAEPIGTATEAVVATNSVYHDSEHASHLRLPFSAALHTSQEESEPAATAS